MHPSQANDIECMDSPDKEGKDMYSYRSYYRPQVRSMRRPGWGYGRPRPYGGYGGFGGFGPGLVGGFLGGVVGSALFSPYGNYYQPYPYPYPPYYPYPYNY